MRNYGKIAGHRVNIQKLIAFLYMSNNKTEFEINTLITFTLTPPKGNT